MSLVAFLPFKHGRRTFDQPVALKHRLHKLLWAFQCDNVSQSIKNICVMTDCSSATAAAEAAAAAAAL